MEISASLVKELRDKSGVGVLDCKKALMECNGDIDQAMDHLRKKGIATAKKRGGRITSEGQVQSYIHAGGKIGVLVEVNCETDFTGKTEDFTERIDRKLVELLLIERKKSDKLLVAYTQLKMEYDSLRKIGEGEKSRR